jgi:hypothetical protein
MTADQTMELRRFSSLGEANVLADAECPQADSTERGDRQDHRTGQKFGNDNAID